jgi:hypothetical protein
MGILDEIYNYVNSVYGIDIKEKTRKRAYSDGRALFCHIVRKKTNFTYQCIGDYLNKDHATVMYAVKVTSNYLDKEVIAEALKHFNLVDEMPRDTVAYLQEKTKQLSEQLEQKTEVLRMLPKLEDVYNNLNNLTEEQKQKVNRRNELQFDTIGRCLDRVEELIEKEKDFA